jgi:hypothetical protein
MSDAFVRIHESRPPEGSGTIVVQVGQRWFELVGSISPKLPEPVRVAARLLFSQREETRTKERICLCADCVCPRKDGLSRELPDCPRNCYGICVDATLEANDGVPLSLQAIGYLTGMSKQAAGKHYDLAKKELIAKVLETPELLELCLELGIGRKFTESNEK